MVQVDLPAAFALGQIFAFISKKALKKETNLWTNKLSGPVALYMSIGFSPVGLFFLAGWPSWELMYTTGWMENSFNRPMVAAAYIGFLVVMVILGMFGFMLGHWFYRKGKDVLVKVGMVVGLFLTFLPFFVRWGVWWHIGTYEQIQNGQGYSFFESPFVFSWLFIMLYMVISTTITVIALKKTIKNNY